MCDYPLSLQLYSCYRNIYIYIHIYIYVNVYIFFFPEIKQFAKQK